MGYSVLLKAMPGNPAENNVGDKSGLWQIIFEDMGDGAFEPLNPKQTVHSKNLKYEDAERIASELSDRLNGG